MASQDWFEKDFYAILGVSKDADGAAIKKAYRKLARQYHPDKNPGDTAAEQKFKDIGEAHAVLSDSKQRQEYDAIRSMAGGGARFRAGGPGGGGGGFEDIFSAFGGGGGGTRVRYSTGGGGAGEPDINDLLAQMFGGGMPGGAGQRGGDPFSGFGASRGPQPGRDVQARTTLSFRDAVQGATVTLGTGHAGQVTTKIPAGVKDGQKIRLRGKGSQGDPGAPAGDLIIDVTVQPHPVFGRDGDHLTVDLPVTFAEATLGATVSVPTLDGESVRVRIAAGTPSGRVLRVRGRGVHKKDGSSGDLLVRVSVVVPQDLSDEARAAVEVLAAEAQDTDPRSELMAKAKV